MCHIRILILAVLAVSISAKLNAADLTALTGNDWLGWPEVQQIQFLAGAAYGMNVSTQQATQTIQEFTEPFQTLERETSQVDITHAALVLLKAAIARNGTYNVSVAQLHLGVKSFYSDFKNRSIGIFDAMHYVDNQIKGVDEQDQTRILRYLRQGKTQEARKGLSIYDKSGNLVRDISFP